MIHICFLFLLQLYYASVDGDDVKAPFDLSAVVLEQSPEKDIPLTDPYLDPKEVYLHELFTPNRFSAHTLRKALGVRFFFFFFFFFFF